MKCADDLHVGFFGFDLFFVPRCGPGEFPDLVLCRSEVDEQTVFDARCSEITQDLGDVLVAQITACLHFHNQPAVDETIGLIFTQNLAVHVADRERPLRTNGQSLLSQTMHKPVFINLLQHPRTQVTM